jgi:hypothetical protein
MVWLDADRGGGVDKDFVRIGMLGFCGRVVEGFGEGEMSIIVLFTGIAIHCCFLLCCVVVVLSDCRLNDLDVV